MTYPPTRAGSFVSRCRSCGAAIFLGACVACAPLAVEAQATCEKHASHESQCDVQGAGKGTAEVLANVGSTAGASDSISVADPNSENVYVGYLFSGGPYVRYEIEVSASVSAASWFASSST